jgi:mRNA-degrading endonuclease RelE of RelBE toxin-antitoxin system
VEAVRLRVEDYGVIVDVDWEREIIRGLTLGHRSTVCRYRMGRSASR